MDSNPLGSALYSRIYCDLIADPRLGAFEQPLGSLPPDVSIRTVAASQLLRSIVKKWEDSPLDVVASLEKEAFDAYRAANTVCGTWSPEIPDSLTPHEFFRELVGEYRQVVYNAFHARPDPLVLFPRKSHGPAFSDVYFDMSESIDWPKISYFADVGSGTCQGAANTSWIGKFSDPSEITYTNSFLKGLYVQHIHDYALAASDSLAVKFVRVCGNRFTSVPKTVSERRGIGIEATLEMFFQKGSQYLLECILLSEFGINLSDQQACNRSLAQQGSVFGNFVTLDLKQASNSLSTGVVKFSLPRHIYDILVALRSKKTTWKDADGVETVLDLDIFCSMGNAFCFPLQTIIFASAVRAVYSLLRLPYKGGPDGTFGVNGDDIIVVPEAARLVVWLLNYLGFTVNHDKSFFEGPFRESCGGDFYQGHPVRGVYCKTLRTDQDINSLINRLVRWSATHSIPLRGTISWLRSKLKRQLYVPPFEDDAAGIKLPLAFVPKRCAKVTTSDWVRLYNYEYYTVKPNTIRINDEWRYTPLMTLMAAVKGELRRERLVLRSEESKSYTLRRASAPNWDTTVSQSGGDELAVLPNLEDWGSWMESCYTNIKV